MDEWVLRAGRPRRARAALGAVYWAQPEQLAATTVPVLSITGMYDDSSGGTIHNWRRFVRHAPAEVVAASHLVVGPWDHMGTHFGEGKVGELVFGPEATVPLAELRRDWLRHILHGAPPPEFLRDRVMLYLAGTERWISASSLEAATTGSVTRYLRSTDGPMDATHSGFVEDAPAAGPDAAFTCDPFDLRTHDVELQPRPAGSGPESPFHGQPMNSFFHVLGGNDPTNPRFVLDLDGQGVVYTSRVLADDITIIGEPELHLRAGVRPARRRHRGFPPRDHADGGLDLPQQRRAATELPPTSTAHIEYLVPGEPTDVAFGEFKWCTRTVQAGSRLRLAIRHAYAIQVTPYSHGRPADAPAAHVRILHDAASAPRLILPTGAP